MTPTPPLTRRDWLAAAAGAAGAIVAGLARTAAGGQDPTLTAGRLVATLPIDQSRGRVQVETLLGQGLDARLFTDLSTLTKDTLVTPNDRFFIRTATPPQLPANSRWPISVEGLVRQRVAVNLEALVSAVRSAGECLLECSGNSAPTYGLMSAARWDGVPVGTLLDRAQSLPGANRVLVSGLDDVTHQSNTSVPGASWIFDREDLERAGAFLATHMNGVPLPSHHGGPVRLVVPGWYGCACIKWVNAVQLVADDAPPTTQMREFAARTHQNGVPSLARDFIPATIDHAAMPVRVEKWLVDGGLVYRVVGILWGGSKATNALLIQFRTDQPFVPVSDCALPASTKTWSLWSHIWRPSAPGRYQIALRVNDPALRTRRLDSRFYAREVAVDEV